MIIFFSQMTPAAVVRRELVERKKSDQEGRGVDRENYLHSSRGHAQKNV